MEGRHSRVHAGIRHEHARGESTMPPLRASSEDQDHLFRCRMVEYVRKLDHKLGPPILLQEIVEVDQYHLHHPRAVPCHRRPTILFLHLHLLLLMTFRVMPSLNCRLSQWAE